MYNNFSLEKKKLRSLNNHYKKKKMEIQIFPCENNKPMNDLFVVITLSGNGLPRKI